MRLLTTTSPKPPRKVWREALGELTAWPKRLADIVEFLLIAFNGNLDVPVVLFSAEAHRESGSEEDDGKPAEHSLINVKYRRLCMANGFRKIKCTGSITSFSDS
jgi:hypothetical protein